MPVVLIQVSFKNAFANDGVVFGIFQDAFQLTFILSAVKKKVARGSCIDILTNLLQILEYRS